MWFVARLVVTSVPVMSAMVVRRAASIIGGCCSNVGTLYDMMEPMESRFLALILWRWSLNDSTSCDSNMTGIRVVFNRIIIGWWSCRSCKIWINMFHGFVVGWRRPLPSPRKSGSQKWEEPRRRTERASGTVDTPQFCQAGSYWPLN